MAPKVTSSSNRSKRSSAKPVTKGQNPQRSNRQAVSNATVTKSGGGRKGSARVTNDSQRKSDVGSIMAPPRSTRPSPRAGGRVVVDESPRLSSRGALATTTTNKPTVSRQSTGSSRPALPPGTRGGALATRSTKPTSNNGNARPALPPGKKGGAVTKASTNKPNGGPVQSVRVRDMGKPQLSGSGSRPALGAGNAPKPNAAGGAGGVRGLLNGRAPISLGGLRGGLLGIAGGMAADAVGRKAGEAIGTGLRNATNAPKSDKRSNLPGGRTNPGRSTGKPATDGRYVPGSQQVKFNQPKPKPKPPASGAAPAASRSSSGGNSGGGSSRPSSAAPSRSTPSKPPASAPKPPNIAKVETETTDAPKPPTTEATSTKKESLKISSGRRPVGREEMIEYNMRRRKKQG
jgi:hypothetical protein